MAATDQNARNIDRFKREFGEALNEGNASLFVGAGLSAAAGYVDWRELLREIASDLGLEVDRETDLIALAQFHFNDRQSRSGINKKLIDEFTKSAVPTENHRLIADLPLSAIWTVNYDTLIEDSFRAAGRRPDVKISPSSLDQRLPRRDVVIYKMHGDVSDPGNAVLIKDDYETYNDGPRAVYTTLLKGDLIRQRFLFLGFSFTDPNIDFVLARIRALLGQHRPEHFCVIRRPRAPSAGSDAATMAEYDYESRRVALRVDDLKRYGITALLIDDFADITNLLRELRRASMLRNVFVSGAFKEPHRDIDLIGLSNALGYMLATKRENLVTGLGRQIGSAVLSGFVAGAYDAELPIDDRLIIMPFPGPSNGIRAERYHEHRNRMILRSGIILIVSGNKNVNGSIIDSPGVREEYELALEHGRYVIAIAPSGSAASAISREITADPNRYYKGIDVARELAVLGASKGSIPDIVAAVSSMIDKILAHNGYKLRS